MNKEASSVREGDNEEDLVIPSDYLQGRKLDASEIIQLLAEWFKEDWNLLKLALALAFIGAILYWIYPRSEE